MCVAYYNLQICALCNNNFFFFAKYDTKESSKIIVVKCINYLSYHQTLYGADILEDHNLITTNIIKILYQKITKYNDDLYVKYETN